VDQEKVLNKVWPSTMFTRPFRLSMGGLFINYFNDFGRTWQVYVEAEAPYRSIWRN